MEASTVSISGGGRNAGGCPRMSDQECGKGAVKQVVLSWGCISHNKIAVFLSLLCPVPFVARRHTHTNDLGLYSGVLPSKNSSRIVLKAGASSQ